MNVPANLEDLARSMRSSGVRRARVRYHDVELELELGDELEDDDEEDDALADERVAHARVRETAQSLLRSLNDACDCHASCPLCGRSRDNHAAACLLHALRAQAVERGIVGPSVVTRGNSTRA